MKTMLRRWSKRAIFAGGYIFFLVLLLEAALRGAGFLLLFHHNTSSDHSHSDGDRRIRILAIGESTTFGQGVRPTEAYPHQLELLLNQGKVKYHVVNLGVPGQVSTSILRNLHQQMQAYRPQLVISLFGTNDLNDALNGLNSRIVGEFVMPEFISELHVFRLYSVARDYFHSKTETRSNGEWLFYDQTLKKGYKPPPPDAPELLQLKQNYQEVIDVVRSYGSKILIISYLNPDPTFRDLYASISATKKVEYVDLYSPTTYRREFFLADKFHPNARGHRTIATKIYEKIRKEKALLQLK